MCLPRLDSASVFGALLDRDAGSFRFGPTDIAVPASRRYIPGTIVLETTWMARTGWMVVRDALVIGPWHHDRVHESSHRRPPDDYDAEHVLLRLAHCVQGTVELNMQCEPVFAYGRLSPDWEWIEDDYHRAVARAKGVDDLELQLATDLRVGFEGRRCEARTTLQEGQTAYVAMSWAGDHELPLNHEDAGACIDRTKKYWRQWLDRGEFPDHPWRVYLQRSALTPKGLTYAPTGGIAAAAPRRCPRRRAGSATGTTATPGSVTPPSPCGGCTRSASTTRPTTSSTSWRTPAVEATGRSRSCTASAARRSSRRRCSTISTATRVRARCAWATPPTSRSSTTCGAPRSTRCTSTPSRATTCPSSSGRCSRDKWRRR